MIQAEPRLETCSHCAGKGKIDQLTHRTFCGHPIAERITCPRCYGTGEVLTSQDSTRFLTQSEQQEMFEALKLSGSVQRTVKRV